MCPPQFPYARRFRIGPRDGIEGQGELALVMTADRSGGVEQSLVPYGIALQHGLPLITTATIGATAIFAGTGAASLAPPRSVSALAVAVRDLLVNDLTRENLERAGQDLFTARYQAALAASELDQIVSTANARWHTTREGQIS